MLFSHLKYHYDAQAFINAELDRMAAYINPHNHASVAHIARLADFPNKYFESAESWTDAMRASADLRELIYTGMGTMYTDKHLRTLKEIVDAELKIYALCEATREYYRASNMPIPEELASENRRDLDACKKRLSTLESHLDNLLDEAVDEPNPYSITGRMETTLANTQTGYLENLRRGYDYKTSRAYELDALAHKYLLAANAFTDTGGLHLAIQMLRLEEEPQKFRGEKHQEAHASLQNDIRHARELTAQALKLFPALAKPQSAHAAKINPPRVN
jgi:hypothetical protein